MNDDLFTDEPPPSAAGADTTSLFTDESPPSQEETGLFGQKLAKGPSTIEPEEQVRNEPGLLETSIPDALAVQGAAGLVKGAVGLGAKALMRGAGEALPENVVESAGRIANNQLLKSTGASMGQIRQTGPELSRQAAETARKSGIGDVFSTEIGREQALTNLDKTTGAAIGGFREEAGKAGSDILEKALKQVAPKYAVGVESSQQGALEKAVETVKNIIGENPTHADYAKAATALNDFAVKNKLYQPVNAVTDLANAISRENNAQIAQSLGSDKALDYLKSLSEEQSYKVLEPFFSHGELREMASRGGGKGVLQSIVQTIADKGGYRLSSKLFDAIYKAMTEPANLTQAATGAAKAGAKMIPAGVAEWLQGR